MALYPPNSPRLIRRAARPEADAAHVDTPATDAPARVNATVTPSAADAAPSLTLVKAAASNDAPTDADIIQRRLYRALQIAYGALRDHIIALYTPDELPRLITTVPHIEDAAMDMHQQRAVLLTAAGDLSETFWARERAVLAAALQPIWYEALRAGTRAAEAEYTRTVGMATALSAAAARHAPHHVPKPDVERALAQYSTDYFFRAFNLLVRAVDTTVTAWRLSGEPVNDLRRRLWHCGLNDRAAAAAAANETSRLVSSGRGLVGAAR